MLSGHLRSEEIGRGGSARVLRAERREGSRVAVKVAARPELASALPLRRAHDPRRSREGTLARGAAFTAGLLTVVACALMFGDGYAAVEALVSGMLAVMALGIACAELRSVLPPLSTIGCTRRDP